MTQFVILKFGGTSVATRKSWGHIGQIAQRSLIEGLKPIIVCSAITGVSNLLENIVLNIKQGKDFRPLFDAFKKIHQDLAQELGLDYNLILNPDILQLERVLTGTSLIQEVSPKIQACIMAFGELLSTRLGAAFLVQENISTAWVDARSCLTSTQSNYLSAHCSFESDPELIHRFVSIAESVILTQGFIAKDPGGDTVLLGRGGSDTSAAYFAAKLGAKRCEIWTDVAGMYTANPREVSDARLLKQLDYDEAQEIATMGAKVLHPRCLLPVKQHQIPMYVRSTLEPEHLGTVISQGSLDETPCVKSISTKSNVTLLSIESLGMWQEVGFLADLFACFKQNGISIDLVSTSETNVTVSIDNPSSLDQLIQSIEEKELGAVTIVESCAAVSLVGHRIRSILHQLGPALEVFEEQKVYLVSQAASDLNLTFVVEEQARLTLVQKLHHLLFKGTEEKNKLWWHDEQERLLELSKTNSPLYVYDSETLTQSAKQLLALKSIDRVFYALKANDHQEILKTFFKLGLGFESVSMGEIIRVFELFPEIDPKRILFTPNFAPKHEYAFALSKKCQVTLDSVFPLEQWPELLTNQEIFLRLDPGEGKGHHQHVKTAGQQSKFGISIHEIEQVWHLVKQHHVRVVGLQAHAGSGIMDPEHWSQVALLLIKIAASFKDVKVLDLGGGLGISLDLKKLDQSLQIITQGHPEYEFWLEPGRYLVAEAGVLLTHVTQLKEKNSVSFVGVDAGMNSLIRPMLYGAYHPIVNLTKLEEAPSMTAHVVGPICESGDTLGYHRRLPKTDPTDVFLIANTGAYGHVMSSEYNRRSPATEYYLNRKES